MLNEQNRVRELVETIENIKRNATAMQNISRKEESAEKKNCINDWLKSHNPSPNNFRKAVINFTKSCAAYSVPISSESAQNTFTQVHEEISYAEIKKNKIKVYFG